MTDNKYEKNLREDVEIMHNPAEKQKQTLKSIKLTEEYAKYLVKITNERMTNKEIQRVIHEKLTKLD